MTDTSTTEPLAAASTAGDTTAAAPQQAFSLGDAITAVGNSLVDHWWAWLIGMSGFVVVVLVVVVVRGRLRNRLEMRARQRRVGTTDRGPGEPANKALQEWEARAREDRLLKERNAVASDLQTKIEQRLREKGLGAEPAALSLDEREDIRADFNREFPIEPSPNARPPRDRQADPLASRREEFVTDWADALHASLTNAAKPREGQPRSALTAALAPFTKVQAARKQRNTDRQRDQLAQIAAAQQSLVAQAESGTTQGLQEQQQALMELDFQVQAINPAAPGAAARLDATQRQLDQATGVGMQQSAAHARKVTADMQHPVSTGRRAEEEERKVYQEPGPDAPGSERDEPPRGQDWRID
jgi:hypothetical protein